jgi:hypothetical protein
MGSSFWASDVCGAGPRSCFSPHGLDFDLVIASNCAAGQAKGVQQV